MRNQILYIPTAASAVLGTMLATALPASGQTNTTTKLEQDNQELRNRLDKLEDLLKKEGIKPSTETKDPPVAAMSAVTISGFVTASYFYDAGSTKDNHPAGYLWNTSLNSFSVNEIKLTLASPAVDKEKWDAAYRASFIWGEDAPVVDTASKSVGGFSWLREAYVELNIPIGTGLDVKAGELISLLNYESGDGGAVNDNFSQGYQWYYTGNPPNAGVQLGYDFNDWIGIKLRVENGLYSGPVATGPKTFMGGVYVQPDKKTSLAFLGFEGHQNFAPPWDIAGASFIGSRKLLESHNVTLATELDYFRFYNFDSTAAGFAGGATSGDFWSVGAWLGADITEKLRIALRGEYLADPTGFGTFYNSPAPLADSSFSSGMYTTGAGQDLESLTLTLNYKPVTLFKIQPEIRWNHSNYTTGFGLKKDQVIVGMGASYLF
ncbi:MAG: outer membrane beta-barrel protein [Limisphaerales bacterium]